MYPPRTRRSPTANRWRARRPAPHSIGSRSPGERTPKELSVRPRLRCVDSRLNALRQVFAKLLHAGVIQHRVTGDVELHFGAVFCDVERRLPQSMRVTGFEIDIGTRASQVYHDIVGLAQAVIDHIGDGSTG